MTHEHRLNREEVALFVCVNLQILIKGINDDYKAEYLLSRKGRNYLSGSRVGQGLASSLPYVAVADVPRMV